MFDTGSKAHGHVLEKARGVVAHIRPECYEFLGKSPVTAKAEFGASDKVPHKKLHRHQREATVMLAVSICQVILHKNPADWRQITRIHLRLAFPLGC